MNAFSLRSLLLIACLAAWTLPGFAGDDLAKEVRHRVVFGHDAGIVSIAVSADGTRIASADHHRMVVVRETETGKVVTRIRPVGGGAGVEFVDSGRQIQTNGWGGPLAIWDKDFRLVVSNSAFSPRLLGRDVSSS